MQSASDTFSEVLITYNWCKHHARNHKGGKSGLAKQDYLQRYLVYCEVYKIPRRVGFLQVPIPGPLFLPNPEHVALGVCCYSLIDVTTTKLDDLECW